MELRRAIILLVLTISLTLPQICFGIQANKRQGGESRPLPAVPADDLRPPPELSAAFPTLRPRAPPLSPPARNPPPQNQPPPRSSSNVNSPPRDLVPPPRPGNLPPVRNNPPSSSPQTTTTEFPLLPPIEIPPERPIDDPSTLQTEPQTDFKPTSFLPTTGQGNPAEEFTLGGSLPPLTEQQLQQPSSPQPQVNTSTQQKATPSSTIKFPDSNAPGRQQVPNRCPTCECTTEVDYICANNGAVYLNSCAFDCATTCVEGLKKVPLDFCSSQNQQKK